MCVLVAHAYKGPRVLATTGLGGHGPSGEGQSYGTWRGLLGNPPGRPRIPAPETLCTEGMTQWLSSPPHLASPLTEGPPTAQTPRDQALGDGPCPPSTPTAGPVVFPRAAEERCAGAGRASAQSRGAEGRAFRGVQAGLLPLGASDSNLGPLGPGRALLGLPRLRRWFPWARQAARGSSWPWLHPGVTRPAWRPPRRSGRKKLGGGGCGPRQPECQVGQVPRPPLLLPLALHKPTSCPRSTGQSLHG